MISNNIPITNVHHVAFRCRDAEQTRWFYEDILGLKLAAAKAYDHLTGTEKKIEYMHNFFEMVMNILLLISLQCPEDFFVDMKVLIAMLQLK